jgi:DNA-binding transcriptional regulator YbjK
MTAAPGRTAKGDRRRAELARAAADLVREDGPAALSHRGVAARAGVSLSATTYYFSGLDELAAAAGSALVDEWVAHAEAVLGRAEPTVEDPAATVVEAVLPPGDDAAVRAHYEQLAAAGRLPALAAALGAGRARLDDVLDRLLAVLRPVTGGGPGPAVVLALVDGAALAALSEGRDVRSGARDLLHPMLHPMLHGVLGGVEPLR